MKTLIFVLAVAWGMDASASDSPASSPRRESAGKEPAEAVAIPVMKTPADAIAQVKWLEGRRENPEAYYRTMDAMMDISGKNELSWDALRLGNTLLLMALKDPPAVEPEVLRIQDEVFTYFFSPGGTSKSWSGKSYEDTYAAGRTLKAWRNPNMLLLIAKYSGQLRKQIMPGFDAAVYQYKRRLYHTEVGPFDQEGPEKWPDEKLAALKKEIEIWNQEVEHDMAVQEYARKLDKGLSLACQVSMHLSRYPQHASLVSQTQSLVTWTPEELVKFEEARNSWKTQQRPSLPTPEVLSKMTGFAKEQAQERIESDQWHKKNNQAYEDSLARLCASSRTTPEEIRKIAIEVNRRWSQFYCSPQSDLAREYRTQKLTRWLKVMNIVDVHLDRNFDPSGAPKTVEARDHHAVQVAWHELARDVQDSIQMFINDEFEPSDKVDVAELEKGMDKLLSNAARREKLKTPLFNPERRSDALLPGYAWPKLP